MHSKYFCRISCEFCHESFIGEINLNNHKKYECIKIQCQICPYKGFDHICDINGFPYLCVEIK